MAIRIFPKRTLSTILRLGGRVSSKELDAALDQNFVTEKEFAAAGGGGDGADKAASISVANAVAITGADGIALTAPAANTAGVTYGQVDAQSAVALVNELRSKVNTLTTLVNEQKTSLNGAIALVNQLKTTVNTMNA